MRWLALLLAVLSGHGAVPVVAGYDAKVLNWQSRSVPQGVPAAPLVQMGTTYFLRNIRRGGLYPGGKIIRANLFSSFNGPPASAFPKVPVIANVGNALDLASGSSGSWSYSLTGAAGGLQNSVSDYIDTGVLPSTAFSSITNAHLSVYVTVSTNLSAESEIGCYPNLTDSQRICALYANDGGTVKSWMFSAGSPGPTSTSDSANPGYYIASATVGSNSLYRAGSLVARGASGGNLPSTVNVYLFAIHLESPSVANFSLKRLGAYTLGAGLSDADAALLTSAMNSYQKNWLKRP